MSFGRRVVAGLDPGGRAAILSDGVAPRTVESPSGSAASELLWLDGVPTSLEDGDDRPSSGWPLEPPAGGASFRLIRLPLAGGWLRVEGDDPARPGLHRTDTLDVAVVIDGRILLGLDDGDHELRAGDVVVQRATTHRWRVIGDGPCTYAVLMLRPDPGAPAPPIDLTVPSGSPGLDGVRRLVTATDADGHSYLASDGAPPVALPADGTPVTTDLWQTGGRLRTAEQGGDGPGPWELEPLAGPSGAVACRYVQLPAGHDPGLRGWHATATIDIDLVVSGRLELSLPDVDPVVVGPGEAVIQRGSVHRWRPLGDEPVGWFAVMFGVPGVSVA